MPGTKWPEDFRSSSILNLNPDFYERVNSLIGACRRKKLNLVPFSTRRGPLTQGRMWCQSRTVLEVQSQRNLLEAAGAKKLAAYLRDDWAACGRWTTDKLPGQSWHQWGEACDFFVEVGGKSVWTDRRLTDVLGPIASDLSLEAGSKWSRGRDVNHVQLRKEYTPNQVGGGTPWDHIQQVMANRYELSQLIPTNRSESAV